MNQAKKGFRKILFGLFSQFDSHIYLENQHLNSCFLPRFEHQSLELMGNYSFSQKTILYLPNELIIILKYTYYPSFHLEYRTGEIFANVLCSKKSYIERILKLSAREQFCYVVPVKKLYFLKYSSLSLSLYIYIYIKKSNQ